MLKIYGVDFNSWVKLTPVGLYTVVDALKTLTEAKYFHLLDTRKNAGSMRRANSMTLILSHTVASSE